MRRHSVPTPDSSTTDLTDDALVGLALQDGRGGVAFRELHARHAPAVERYVRRRLPAAVVDDVVQDTFVRFWRRLDRFDVGRGSVAAYLCTIARSSCADARRRDARSPEPVGDFAGREPATQLDDRVELRHAVRSALSELSAPHRRAVELAYYGGYSQSEIATVLAVPIGTVKTRTHWALRQLRSSLAPAVAA